MTSFVLFNIKSSGRKLDKMSYVNHDAFIGVRRNWCPDGRDGVYTLTEYSQCTDTVGKSPSESIHTSLFHGFSHSSL